VIGVVLSTASIAAFAGIAGFLLHRLLDRVWGMVPMVELFLALHTFLIATLSFVLITVHCILIIRLFHELNAEIGVIGPESGLAVTASGATTPGIGTLLRYLKLGLLGSLTVFIGLC